MLVKVSDNQSIDENIYSRTTVDQTKVYKSFASQGKLCPIVAPNKIYITSLETTTKYQISLK